MALLVCVPAAHAVEFANDDGAISIPPGGAATPSPSYATVDDMFGPITDINIHLRNMSHDNLDDVDILIVAPSGTSAWLMSDVCASATTLVGDDITLDQDSGNAFPDGANCDEGTFRPANYDGDSDTLPPSLFTTPVADLDVFNGEVPNGTWQLFVRDAIDESGNMAGQIADGWAIEVETGSANVLIPAGSSSAISSAYPMEILMDEPDSVLTDLDVKLVGLAHEQLAHVDMFLEGPTGQKVWLMSDACPGGHDPVDLMFDDAAANPIFEAEVCNTNTYRPANFGGLTDDNTLIPPAPAVPPAESTTLQDFELTDPDGLWRLWVANDSEGTSGFMQTYQLHPTTRPAASVGFEPGSATGGEGSSVAVDVVRSGDGDLGAAEITAATTSGTALAGDDFAPVSETISFAAGETRKTIQIPIAADGGREPTESFSLVLGNPVGDAMVGTPGAASITIPADTDFVPDPPANAFDPPPLATFTAAGSATSPSARRCRRKGTRIRFRPRNTTGLAIVRSEVFVNGQLLEDNIGDAAAAPINLTMTGRRMRVRVRLHSHDGRVVTIRRTFRRCAKAKKPKPKNTRRRR